MPDIYTTVCDFTDTGTAYGQVWRYNFGQRVELIGTGIDETMTVQWHYNGVVSVDSRPITKTGTQYYAAIPNEALEQLDKVVGYIFTFNATTGNTIYAINISIMDRPSTLEDVSVDVHPINVTDVYLANTTHAVEHGIIYKNSIPFIHDFNYGNNGTVITNGKNTFVGENSGNITMGSTATSVAEGSHNTAIGANALNENTTGYDNTAAGYNTLTENTTGYGNIAVGAGALSVNTTGSTNIAIGLDAMVSNESGYNNTAIGLNVMTSMISGSENVAVGTGAIQDSEIGTKSVGVGDYALQSALGDDNVGVGFNAGSAIVNGENNVFVGSGAGIASGGQTDTTNSIAIGKDAFSTKDNQTVIGNTSTTEALIYGMPVLPDLAWTTYDPVITWNGTAPTGISEYCKHMRIGNIVFIRIHVTWTDGNDASGVIIPVPFTVQSSTIPTPIIAHLKVDTTWSMPLMYVSPTINNFISTRTAFSLTNGTAGELSIMGQFEV